ncbi:MAG: ATP-grasp domain-containing protein [Collinsella sp.]
MLPHPPRAAFDAVCDKDTFAELCAAHGLETPRTEVARLAGDEPIAPCAIPFPVVAKPSVSAGYYDFLLKGFKKVYFLSSQAELDELWRDLRNAGFTDDFLVQELIGGDDTHMDSLTLYIGRDGAPRLLGAAQVLPEDHAPDDARQPRRDGHPREARAMGKGLRTSRRRRIPWLCQFRYQALPSDGPRGLPRLQPRMGRNSYYNVAGGVNPMEVLVRDAIDGIIDEPRRADKPALYSLVPLPLLKRYVPAGPLLDEVNNLASAKRVFDPQRYAADASWRRRLDVTLTETNQYRKFCKVLSGAHRHFFLETSAQQPPKLPT